MFSSCGRKKHNSKTFIPTTPSPLLKKMSKRSREEPTFTVVLVDFAYGAAGDDPEDELEIILAGLKRDALCKSDPLALKIAQLMIIIQGGGAYVEGGDDAIRKIGVTRLGVLEVLESNPDVLKDYAEAFVLVASLVYKGIDPANFQSNPLYNELLRIIRRNQEVDNPVLSQIAFALVLCLPKSENAAFEFERAEVLHGLTSARLPGSFRSPAPSIFPKTGFTADVNRRLEIELRGIASMGRTPDQQVAQRHLQNKRMDFNELIAWYRGDCYFSQAGRPFRAPTSSETVRVLTEKLSLVGP